jgi:hypothetical protein
MVLRPWVQMVGSNISGFLLGRAAYGGIPIARVHVAAGFQNAGAGSCQLKSWVVVASAR